MMYRFPTDPPRRTRAPGAYRVTPSLYRSHPVDRARDLHSQLEDLLDAVWDAEANWRFDDRLDLALRRIA